MKRTFSIKTFSITAILCVLAAFAAGTPAFSAALPEDMDPIALSFATIQTAAGVEPKALVYFKEIIEERSGGKITVEVFTDGVLGTEREIMEQVLLGSLDMTHGGASAYAVVGNMPKLDMWDVPYINTSYAMLVPVMNQVLLPSIEPDLLSIGVRPLWGHAAGFRCILSKTPIRQPADLKGKKHRISDSVMNNDMVNAWGGSPTVVSPPEIYTALQSNIVDEIDMSIVSVINNSWFEQAKYATLTNHVCPMHIVVINEDRWQTFPPEAQALIMECGKETSEYEIKLQEESDAAYYAMFVERGGEIIEFTPEQLAEMRALMQPMYDRNIELYGCGPIYDKIAEVQAPFLK